MALTKECKQEMEHLLTFAREAKAISDRRCVPIADEQLLL